MGEAIIVGRGAGSDSFGGTLKTEIINSNTLWIAPKVKDQRFSIRLFGGGAGGLAAAARSDMPTACGGMGGHMNNAVIALLPGEEIQITIGKGGNGCSPSSTGGLPGGTTSFGTYLAANGASFDNGGTGRGTGFVVRLSNGKSYSQGKPQSTSYGGGGGGLIISGYQRGGIFGGGGGGLLGGNELGGTYGGNGGSSSINAENGTNTIGNSNIPDGSSSKFDFHINLQGAGIGGGYCGGGGGYGGNGGKNGGGGGGYGGDGGNGYIGTVQGTYENYTVYSGGGGGGYGGDGGHAYQGSFKFSSNNLAAATGGGGGGYGPSGKGGNGTNGVGGAGGIAAGGGGGNTNGGKGGNGICIIQYFI